MRCSAQTDLRAKAVTPRNSALRSTVHALTCGRQDCGTQLAGRGTTTIWRSAGPRSTGAARRPKTAISRPRQPPNWALGFLRGYYALWPRLHCPDHCDSWPMESLSGARGGGSLWLRGRLGAAATGPRYYHSPLFLVHDALCANHRRLDVFCGFAQGRGQLQWAEGADGALRALARSLITAFAGLIRLNLKQFPSAKPLKPLPMRLARAAKVSSPCGGGAWQRS